MAEPGDRSRWIALLTTGIVCSAVGGGLPEPSVGHDGSGPASPVAVTKIGLNLVIMDTLEAYRRGTRCWTRKKPSRYHVVVAPPERSTRDPRGDMVDAVWVANLATTVRAKLGESTWQGVWRVADVDRMEPPSTGLPAERF